MTVAFLNQGNDPRSDKVVANFFNIFCLEGVKTIVLKIVKVSLISNPSVLRILFLKGNISKKTIYGHKKRCKTKLKTYVLQRVNRLLNIKLIGFLGREGLERTAHAESSRDFSQKVL